MSKRALRGIHLVAALAAVASVTACAAGDAADDGAGRAEIRDSAGVTLVDNAAPGDRGGRFRLADAPELAIGVLEGAPEYQLYQVQGAARLGDGRIAVSNAGSHQIRYYDASGNFLKATGREGEGPGEFKQGGILFPLPGDSLLVFDWGSRRLSLLSPQGDFVRSSSVPGGDRFFFPEGMLDDGRVLLQMAMLFGTDNRPKDGVTHDTVGLYIWNWRDDSATIADSAFLRLSSGDHFVATGGSGGNRWLAMTSLLLGATPQTSAGAGRVYYAAGDRYEIRTYDDAGRLQRIVRMPWQPVPVTQEMRDRVARKRLEGTDDENWRKRQEKMMADMPTPEFAPAHGSMTLDRVGRIWLERFDPAMPDAPTYDVFDRDGRWIAAVRFPARFEPMDIGSDYVLGVAKDEMDVEQVQLWKLVPNTVKG